MRCIILMSKAVVHVCHSKHGQRQSRLGGQASQPKVIVKTASKGALVDALGGLALSCAPAVLKAVLQALQAVLSRQPASTKVLIETRDGKFNFEFDPKKIGLQELVGAAERLGGAPPTS
jgi:hypothetical protein